MSDSDPGPDPEREPEAGEEPQQPEAPAESPPEESRRKKKYIAALGIEVDDLGFAEEVQRQEDEAAAAEAEADRRGRIADAAAEVTAEARAGRMPYIVSLLLGIAGAAVGGTIGTLVFGWMVGFGFYALALPGGLLGLGCELLSRRRSILLGIVCGASALALAVYAEWLYRPWLADGSFEYFIDNLANLTPVTKFMAALGAVLAGYFGWGRNHPT